MLNKNEIEIFVEDARLYHQLGRVLNETKPDIIVQLAAVSHANKSNKTPHDTFDHSLRTLENVLDFAKLTKTHIIYMSSSMVYGDFKNNEVDEKTKCNPKGIYAAVKLSGEMILKSSTRYLNFLIQSSDHLHFMEKGVLVGELVKYLLKIFYQIKR